MCCSDMHLPACAGWRAASREPEDHLQSSPAAAAHLPAEAEKHSVNKVKEHKRQWGGGDTDSRPYIVNIMNTALLLVVLFEGAVAVELSVETKQYCNQI